MTASTSYINVTAGSAAATTDTGTSGFLAIDFGTGCTAGGCSNTVFSGSVFSIYLSTNGFSSTAGDLLYAGGPTDKSSFLVTSLEAGWVAVSETNGTFHIGVVNGHGVVEGPVPAKISSNYKYIKIYDGSSTSVAVSAQQIHFLPGLSISPSSGAAGTSVKVSGGGFPSSTTIDINYSYTYQEWNSAPVLKHGQWITGVSTGPGYFTTTATMLDTKQPVNPIAPAAIISNVTITFTAVTHTYPHTVYGVLPVNFTEFSRVFNQEFSYRPDGSIGGSYTSGPYGNDTGSSSETAPVLSLLGCISAYVTGTIGLEGNYSAIGLPVTIWIGSIQMTTATPNSVSGQWVANFTVPALPRGSNLVEVINNGVMYEYDICIVPTLILTPSTGPIGTTVTVTAYGFTPTNSKNPVVLYWFQESWNDGLNYWLANTTVGLNGAFNETSPVQFVVPLSYGGAHNVTASDLCFGKCKAGGSTGSIPSDDVLGLAVFTVTPAFEICKASTCGTGLTNADTISVNANTRTTLMATGTGFGFTCGSPIAYCAAYQVNIDNALYSDFSTYASDSGSLYVNFTAAGFSPGLHQVDLYGCESDACVGAPDAVAYFNVTTIGAYSSSGLTSNATSEINSIYANVKTILGWGTTITTISTNVNTILGWGTTITGISTNVNTILGWGTTFTGLNTNVNGLASTLATIQGTLTTIQGTLTTIQGTLTTLTADVNSATSAATAAQTAAQAANTAATNGKNSVSDTETYVLVVAVLAAITLVLELAILVRKLD